MGPSRKWMEPCGRHFLVAKRDNEEWHINFKLFRNRDDDDRHFRDDMMVRELVLRTYSRIATYDKSPITKFTIAVSNERAYKILFDHVPILLKLNVSFMLLNFGEGKVVEEINLT